MRVLVLGATGRVGKLIVEQALARGHAVTALLRDPRKVGDLAGRLLAIEGDALDRNAVERSVEGQDAVIYALGAGNVRQTNLFSASTQILVNAMERHRIRRLIAITGVGAGDTKGHGGFPYDRVIYPLFTRKIYEDKDRQEALIRATALDWVLLRPAPFQEKVPREDLRVALNVEGVTLRRISPHEVAAFAVDQLESDKYVHQAPFVGHP
jgi:putative NADH-flavin reductase